LLNRVTMNIMYEQIIDLSLSSYKNEGNN
jgi:hypothetical protein